MNFTPLYRGQLLVHGMGFAPVHHTIAVVSIGSNSVTFIDTATNAVKHTTLYRSGATRSILHA
jgi:YVTN family beta-propeller protein